MSNSIATNFTGQVLGTLKAIKPTDNRYFGGVIWELQCTKCNKIIFKNPNRLNDRSSCGNKKCRSFSGKDFSGKMYGTLKAIRPIGFRNSDNSIMWEFECIGCKTYVSKIPSCLNKTSSCGNPKCKIGLTIDDQAGKKFGFLTVISFNGINKNGQVLWNCLCDCGKKRIAYTSVLIRGKLKSCGCSRIYSSNPGDASWGTKWSNHRHSHTKSRELKSELTKKQFIDICSQDCFYCDRSPSPYNCYLNNNSNLPEYYVNHGISKETIKRAWININGIDRINNDIDYLISNCVPCCWPCNKIKSNKSLYWFCAFIEPFQPGFTQKILDKMKNMGIISPPQISLVFFKKEW